VARQSVVKPGQLTIVAERRFADAQALCDTGENARANGAQYLAGIVIDILLKAQLMRRYPEVARKRSHEVKDDERRLWSLIWRSHEIEAMLDQLPLLEAMVAYHGERAGKPYLRWLISICASWDIQLRYSTRTSLMSDAKAMVERVRELKEILK
jgi:hypothetical protein